MLRLVSVVDATLSHFWHPTSIRPYPSWNQFRALSIHLQSLSLLRCPFTCAQRRTPPLYGLYSSKTMTSKLSVPSLLSQVSNPTVASAFGLSSILMERWVDGCAPKLQAALYKCE